MARLEVACSRFAVLSGITQESDNYSTCIQPRGAVGQRKGLLAVVTEPSGEHPSLAAEACRLAQEALIQHYYSENSLSLTSALLKALDSANSALISYNYAEERHQQGTGTDGSVAVRAGGVRTRGAQVGLTAVVVRPDGEGIYVAQMAPTQMYIVHDGILTALPQPAAWVERPGRIAVTLRRVLDTEDEEAGEDLFEPDVEGLPPAPLPATPLGSSTGVEVDLVYRRIDPGDVVAVVSTNLARQIDRALAEEIFTSGSAAEINETLQTMATERGLALAHACVLQLGVETSSGVVTELVPPALAAPVDHADADPAQQQATTPRTHAPLIDIQKFGDPRRWLARRKPSEAAVVEDFDHAASEDGAQDGQQAPGVYSLIEEPVSADSEPEDDAAPYKQPTQVLLQRMIDLPPYRASSTQHQPRQPEDSAVEELDFDGWEDHPPALDDAPQQLSGRNREIWTPDTTKDDGEVDYAQVVSQMKIRPIRAGAVAPYSAENDASAAGFDPMPPSATSRMKLTTTALRTNADRFAKSALTFGQRLLPDRAAGSSATNSPGRGLMVPGRLLIAAGVVLLAGILAFSVLSMAQSPKKAAVNSYLEQAKQENLLGNQPSGTTEERQQHLEQALTLAQQALAAEPQSAEAALLLKNTQASLDTLQGITRLDTKLLFDLDETDNAAASTQTAGAQSPAAPLTSTSQIGGLVLQGNDAFVLDGSKSRVYRCRISARDCSVVLQTGDTAGGQTVGDLTAIVPRVNNVVALDNNLVAYVFSGDTGSWDAQPLGGTDKLDKPRDAATYDGNLYLLGARPSQISKFVSGAYNNPPTDWIQDPASLDQMVNPLAIGIDGAIYVLRQDGTILVLQGGKVTRTFSPRPGDPAPATRLLTGTDMQNIYLLHPDSHSIAKLNKEGQTLSVYKAGAEAEAAPLTGLAVDEGSNKVYLLTQRRVYEAGMAPTAPLTTTNPSSEAPAAIPAGVESTQPLPRPTAEP